MRLHQGSFLRVLPLLAVSFLILAARGVDANLDVTDECPSFKEKQDCVEISSYEEFRDVVQNDRPEGELVLCPFDIQLSQEDKVTWIRTNLHLMCQQLNKCTIRDGAYQMKVHGSNQVTVQGFNFVGATHSAFRVWEKSSELQKVCHCHFESNKGDQKGTSVRLEGPKIFVGHSVFKDNASEQQGAGIYTYHDACVYNSKFVSNSAQRGSGIFVDSEGSLTMKDSDFQMNVANGSGGPAVYVNEGGQYIDGGGNAASDNQGGKNCEGVLMKTECELIFTATDETDAAGEGDSPPMDASAPSVDDSTTDPTNSPSASPFSSTVSPTNVPSTLSPVTELPTALPSILPITPNTTVDESDPPQEGKNIVAIANVTAESTTWLSFVDFKHENGALAKCEGDCNKDEDCEDGLVCFRRAENGGWRNMIVPGCNGDENHPMRKVDYCYDPLDSIDSIIGRGEPDRDEDEVVDDIQEDPTEGVTLPAEVPESVKPTSVESVKPTSVSVSTSPSGAPVTEEPTTAEPSSSTPTMMPVTDEPTALPSLVEPVTDEPTTVEPSTLPTLSPATDEPSLTPTALPSSTPTAMPQAAGTESPTTSPSKRPTSEFTENSEPDDPDGGYFNYDTLSQFGPRRWNKVKPQKTEEYAYWKEFKDVIKEDLDKNYCGSSAQQSPINLFDTGAVCLEYHQIRDRPGDFLQDDVEVEKVIGQNKLRVIWPRRDGDEPDPPGADIPKGWGHIIDATNTDIVVPAEHTINGRQFVGEYRIFHMHSGGKGAAVITALMEIHPLNKRNSHLQKLINEFQTHFDEDMLKCQNKERKKRGLRSLVSSKGQKGVSSLRGKNHLVGTEKFPSYKNRKTSHERQLEKVKFDHDDPSDPYTSFGRWDPYNPEMIPSLWFYGYEGSLTEPPCTPFLSWRIMDKPMYVSSGQLKQIKNLIFNHVDENCKPTSNHHNGIAARPIQKRRKENEVYRCTCKDFTSDKIRAQSGVYQCSDEQYKILHPDESTGFSTAAFSTEFSPQNTKDKGT